MIYISAQPDNPYFLWQLQLQIYNFKSQKIPKDHIHILIGYDIAKGMHPHFKKFIRQCNDALFFTYADTRTKKVYPSSIRPHIIAKHFKTYPFLEKEVLFYHDSDIIFRTLPNWEELINDDIWYCSDTRSYLDSNYIKTYLNQYQFQQMCQIIGVSPTIVQANDKNAGGAQYVIKNSTMQFWNKIEKDCESLYEYLLSINIPKGIYDPYEFNSATNIQAWCADMWAIWWNALLINQPFKISPILDFCWANSEAEEWNKKYILHYTGNSYSQKESLFKKTLYTYYTPFYDDLSTIKQNSCSWYIKELIYKYRQYIDKKRINLQDVTFLLPVQIDSKDRLINTYTILRYIDRYFKTNILLLEADNLSKIKIPHLNTNIKYIFIKDTNKIFHRTHYLNLMIKQCKTSIICICDVDIIIPPAQLLSAVSRIRNKEFQIAIPYSGSNRGIDIITKFIFSKSLDIDLLEENKYKFKVGSQRSCGGAVLIDYNTYIKAGLENEYITSWGPDDVERVKRMEILGYPAKFEEGELYHLYHERNINSRFIDIETQNRLYSEFLKICSMNKIDLINYISTWPWKISNL